MLPISLIVPGVLFLVYQASKSKHPAKDHAAPSSYGHYGAPGVEMGPPASAAPKPAAGPSFLPPSARPGAGAAAAQPSTINRALSSLPGVPPSVASAVAQGLATGIASQAGSIASWFSPSSSSPTPAQQAGPPVSAMMPPAAPAEQSPEEVDTSGPVEDAPTYDSGSSYDGGDYGGGDYTTADDFGG